MFASFFLFYFTLDLKESYLFEEPSLFTKLTDIVVYKSALPLNYNTIRPGIKYIKIVGAIENECILMTFPSRIPLQIQRMNSQQKLKISMKHSQKNPSMPKV